MSYNLESGLAGETSTTLNMQMAESELKLKNLLMRVKEERENVGLKLNIKKKRLRSGHLMPSLAYRRVKGGSSE